MFTPRASQRKKQLACGCNHRTTACCVRRHDVRLDPLMKHSSRSTFSVAPVPRNQFPNQISFMKCRSLGSSTLLDHCFAWFARFFTASVASIQAHAGTGWQAVVVIWPIFDSVFHAAPVLFHGEPSRVRFRRAKPLDFCVGLLMTGLCTYVYLSRPV